MDASNNNEGTRMRGLNRSCRFCCAQSLLLLLFISSTSMKAEDCNTSCDNQCRIFAGVVEPVCKAKCEAVKALACNVLRTTILTIPTSPVEIGGRIGTLTTQACAIPFQAITGAVIAQCSNWDGRLTNQDLINAAMSRLLAVGAMSPGELSGVQVRWCPLSRGSGTTPDWGRVYLDPSLQSNPIATASVLAHELTHIRQYRRMGTDQFKCSYSQDYTNCGGCQDRGNSLEREAYEYQDQVGLLLNPGVTLSAPPGFSITPPGFNTPLPFPAPIQQGLPSGSGILVCGCWGSSPAMIAPERRCASGSARLNGCPGFCQGGGTPYAYVCQ